MNKSLLPRLLPVGLLIAAVAAPLAHAETPEPDELEPVIVYKSPTCGCCSKWARHLLDSGFAVEAINRNDMNSVKTGAGIPRRVASCHTAIVGGYIIEGHVPAADIRQLLKERPDVAGLTVPGMPTGTPGMEGPRQDSYEVLTFTESGDSVVFSRY